MAGDLFHGVEQFCVLPFWKLAPLAEIAALIRAHGGAVMLDNRHRRPTDIAPLVYAHNDS